MKTVLGRKQNMENSKWIDAMEHIEELVTKEELDSLVEDTVKEIEQQTAGKKAAYAWSAGKDSLVLGALCEMTGIKECMLAVCNLEYPTFVEWIQKNKPEGLEIINTGQDMEWLIKHPEMMFPKDCKIAARWFSVVQHRAQAKYYKAHELDVILLGRRRVDGNYCGKGSNIYTDGKGVTRYSPLASWSHEAVLAFIHYYKLQMPPIYEWRNGYLCGTHPWPARQWTESAAEAWKEIYEIDSEIVKAAAEHLSGAKEYLETKK